MRRLVLLGLLALARSAERDGAGLGGTVLTASQVGDLRCRSMVRPSQATAR